MDDLKEKESDCFSIDKEGRSIYLYTKVNPRVTLAITKFIKHTNSLESSLEKKPITIYINSNGGDANGLFGLIQTILSSNIPIYTCCMGTAASAAFVIFLSGKKRMMVTGSRLMWHTVKTTATNPDMQSLRNHLLRTECTQDLFDKFIASRSSFKLEQLYDLREKSGVDSEIWLTTTDALNLNCVDEILSIF